jgi:hypothetical protein
MEPSGRAVAILLYHTILAVLPAISPGVKQSLGTPVSSAAVGNSFVIDLTMHGIRSAKDFTFLHECVTYLLLAALALLWPAMVLSGL